MPDFTVRFINKELVTVKVEADDIDGAIEAAKDLWAEGTYEGCDAWCCDPDVYDAKDTLVYTGDGEEF